MTEEKNERLPQELYVTDGNNSDANKDYNDEHNRDEFYDDDDDSPGTQYQCFIIASALTCLYCRLVSYC